MRERWGHTTLESFAMRLRRPLRIRRIPQVFASTSRTGPRRLQKLALCHARGVIWRIEFVGERNRNDASAIAASRSGTYGLSTLILILLRFQSQFRPRVRVVRGGGRVGVIIVLEPPAVEDGAFPALLLDDGERVTRGHPAAPIIGRGPLGVGGREVHAVPGGGRGRGREREGQRGGGDVPVCIPLVLVFVLVLAFGGRYS